MPAITRSFRSLALFAALVAVLLTTSLAQAGGWFVVTLDALPASPVAGETMTIGFTLRQHGHTPAYWGGLSVVARNPATGQVVRVNPGGEGEVGHYTAALALPEPGVWEWGIDVEREPWVRWAPLTVLAAPASTTASISQPSTLSAPAANVWLPALLALAATILFLLAIRVGRQRRALGGLLGLAAVAGVMALAVLLMPTGESTVTASAAPAAAAAYQVSEGQALFLAKGCVTCHVHDQAPSNGFVRVDIGPVLTHYAAQPDSPFLRQWLGNPASLRPETLMPDLDLSEHEIDSLIAFLASGSQTQ